MAGSKKARAREVIRDRQYRWEFLRRADQYVRHYEAFREAYPGWLECRLDPAWPSKVGALRGEDSDHPPEGGFVATAIEKLESFGAEWGIPPTDPETRGTPFVEGGRLWVTDDGDAQHGPGEPDVLTLSIDTAGPLKEVIGQLEWRIGFHQEQLKTAHPENGTETKSRKRFDKYDDYIRAHDMGYRGLGDAEIAADLGLADQTDAARYREAAAQLIEKAAVGKW